MTVTVTKRQVQGLLIVIALLLSSALLALSPSIPAAQAAGEQASVSFKLTGGAKYKNKKKAKKVKPKTAQLSFGVRISSAEFQIEPMKVANLKFPNNKVMSFNPPKGMPVCKATSVQLAAPAENIYRLCPKSILGNGQANFALGQVVTNDRQGTVVVLYGGRSGKSVRLIFSAWSQDTNAGVNTEGWLQPDGRMYIKMPVLTADSSVTALQVNIPGKTVSGTWDSGRTYTLRPGSAKNFVQAKCRRGTTRSFSANFQLGSRNQLGNPSGPTTYLSAKSGQRC